MKEFKDLEFKPHSNFDGLHAQLDFDNGYGVSVVRFKTARSPIVNMFAKNNEYGSYTSNEDEWEVAVMKDGTICYSTDLTNDVLGNQTESDVTDVMLKLQKLEE